MDNFFGRKSELKDLQTIWDSTESEFVFVRGRRRIGKSELLREFVRRRLESPSRAFMFTGRVDEADAACRERWAQSWDLMFPSSKLYELRRDYLTWDRIFSEIAKVSTEHFKSDTNQFLIVIDEVQWLAKKQSGVLGALKEFWEQGQKSSRLKVFLSGSSNRFFSAEVDHADGVLRGLRTKGDLWITPFTLGEVRHYYFSKWSEEQVALLYMMVGGVPYYLERFDGNESFIHSVNASVFTPASIFLDEIDAVLKLEVTGEGALDNVKNVLGILGQDGRDEKGIADVTGISVANVHSILGRLQSYGLIQKRVPFGVQKKNNSGIRYFADDFFINFYFQIISPNAAKIRGNKTNGLLFKQVIASQSGYYIPNFSGKAFELLIYNLLRAAAGDTSKRTCRLFQHLKLYDSGYNVGTYWQSQKIQIDIVVSSTEDRVMRIIEAKWKSSSLTSAEAKIFVETLVKKEIPVPRTDWQVRRFLAISCESDKSLQKLANQNDVAIVQLSDLFEKTI